MSVTMTPIIRQNLSQCQGIAVNKSGPILAAMPYNYGMDLSNRLRVLGRALREARVEKKWTQGELSDVTRLSVGYISNLENGYINPKRGPVVPSDETIGALSLALDLPVGYFHEVLGRTGQEPSAPESPGSQGAIVRAAVRAADSAFRDAGYQDDNLTPEDEAKLEELFENAVIGLMEKKHRTGG